MLKWFFFIDFEFDWNLINWFEIMAISWQLLFNLVHLIEKYNSYVQIKIKFQNALFIIIYLECFATIYSTICSNIKIIFKKPRFRINWPNFILKNIETIFITNTFFYIVLDSRLDKSGLQVCSKMFAIIFCYIFFSI